VPVILPFIIFYQRKIGSYSLVINHSGIQFSKELSVTTWLGYPFLGIVPQDVKEFYGQLMKPSQCWLRPNAMSFNARARLAKFLGTPGISERLLTIPIEELLTAIQEYFAAELQEHGIVVRGKQF
jgi:hypothetical protein